MSRLIENQCGMNISVKAIACHQLTEYNMPQCQCDEGENGFCHVIYNFNRN